ncbi:NAD binding Rossmann fold oxidoreductase, putative [Penicillium digitatum]|uniref:NAD binding Rossmann fold oxidoreductase, putative n=1 Tax=Penicillium digitatum TaxID=36651 RepID=A0A7T6XIU7_PENDI|nr:NAD binding Rossmann fold oxidoreductase, putative [Penicillium digitatum]
MGDFVLSQKKRYALIGTDGRSTLFYTSIANDFHKTSTLVAICDTNQTRLNYARTKIEAWGHKRVSTYIAPDFDLMITETKPDEVIVTTINRTHHTYIIRALELGCKVITEKLTTIDGPQCSEILSAVDRTNQRGDLKFYAKKNAEERGVTQFYSRTHSSEAAKKDPFALHRDENPQLKSLYLDAEHEDGYFRDQSVFGDGISIEDTMNVLVRYENRPVLTYSLTAYAPWEGFRVSFNGRGGRLEAGIAESSYVNSGGEQSLEGAAESISLLLRPLFQEPRKIEIVQGAGGHGRWENVLLRDLFGEAELNEYMRAASHIDGAASILTGVAANR